VALDETDQLAFALGLGQPDLALLPPDAASAPEGAVVEFAPARTAVMAPIVDHLARHGGAALFVDYGYLEPATGDTLQALRRHAYDEVLAAPGEADLTAHVDFATLAHVARKGGLHVQTTTQGAFLLTLGLLERAGRLGAGMDEAGREAIRQAVERLAGPNQMGNLFKVMALAARALPMAGFPEIAPDN
jgi:SAM-dependent MidA family methyltransferase